MSTTPDYTHTFLQQRWALCVAHSKPRILPGLCTQPFQCTIQRSYSVQSGYVYCTVDTLPGRALWSHGPPVDHALIRLCVCARACQPRQYERLRLCNTGGSSLCGVAFAQRERERERERESTCRSLNATVAQPQNCPRGINVTIELKNINNCVRQ